MNATDAVAAVPHLKQHDICACIAAKAELSVKDADSAVSVKTDVAMKGKASAPGQIAMSLKAEIAATGADLAFNIHGKLASSLAKGADAQSLFLAFAVSAGPGEVTEPEAKAPVEEPPAIEDKVEEPAEDDAAPKLLTSEAKDDFGLEGAEIALKLLTGGDQAKPDETAPLINAG